MNIVKKVKKKLQNTSLLYSSVRWTYLELNKYKEVSFSFLFRVFPIEKNKIVICNFSGRGYGDNGKYIVEEILKENKGYDVVWLLKKEFSENSGLPINIRTVKYGSIKSIYELTTARLWIDNCRSKFFLLKRKSQFYIQTWHGGLGLKKIEADAIHSLGNRYIKYAKRDSALADIFISNSQHLSDIYKRAFWYSGNILECGYPKNDILFSDKTIYRENVRAEYNLKENTKILLYAPTFKNHFDKKSYNIEVSKILDNLNKKDGDDWVFMARLHPNIDGDVFSSIFPKSVINATLFPDMQELVLGIDTLITDYSSCMFDSAIAKIPTFIYASDIKSYMDERGFYFPLDELPFSLAENTQQLISNMSSFSSENYLSDLSCFNKRVGLQDKGDASIRVLKLIDSVITRTTNK